jgi:hypothetical protein
LTVKKKHNNLPVVRKVPVKSDDFVYIYKKYLLKGGIIKWEILFMQRGNVNYNFFFNARQHIFIPYRETRHRKTPPTPTGVGVRHEGIILILA